MARCIDEDKVRERILGGMSAKSYGISQPLARHSGHHSDSIQSDGSLFLTLPTSRPTFQAFMVSAS